MTRSSSAENTVSQAVLDALPEPVFLLDWQAGTIRAANAASGRWAAELGFSGSEPVSVGQVFPDLAEKPAAALGTGAIATHARSASPQVGELRHEVRLSIHPLDEASPDFFVLMVWPLDGKTHGDISIRDALADAFHDSLTRLPNRRLFQRRLRRAIERGAAGGYTFGLLFVDLDGFKEVNDEFGHVHGDQLLVHASHRLVEAVRPQDMVARRDGDEFTILLDDLERPEDANNVAQRIVEHLQAPLLLETRDTTAEIAISASVGVVTSGTTVIDADELIARADAAMYQAKALGGGAYVISPHLAERRAGKPLPR